MLSRRSVLLLSVSSCIGLSIKEANRTLKKQYADDMEITATVNPKNARNNRNISLEKLTELSDNALVTSEILLVRVMILIIPCNGF